MSRHFPVPGQVYSSISAMIKGSKLHIDEVYARPMYLQGVRTDARGPLGVLLMPHPFFMSDAANALRPTPNRHFANLTELLIYAKTGWNRRDCVVAFGAICYWEPKATYVACLASDGNKHRELLLLKLQGKFPEIFGRDQQVLYVETTRP